MNTLRTSTILRLAGKMKSSTIAKASRPRRRGRSIGFAVIFALIIAAAFYSASSASSSRKASRSKLPSSATSSNPAADTNAAVRARELLSALLPGPQPAQSPSLDESVATFEVVADACTTNPKVTFVLGEKVCVRVENAPLRAGVPLRRINFADPRGFVRDTADVTTDPQQSIFPLPPGNTSVIDGETIDNRGTWSASTNSTSDGGTRAIAYFNVSDPLNIAADLAVYDFSTVSDVITPGTNTGFFLWLSNIGPDAAANVHLTMAVPPNMSYIDATTSSAFTCAVSVDDVVDCTLPPMTNWASGAIATITLNFSVSGVAPNGIISSTADIGSDTFDPRIANNSSSAEVEVRSPGAPAATCALGCPADITVTATGPTGAVVNFAGSVEVSGDCGAITYFPDSGSTFGIGPHSVDVTSGGGSGGACSFTVTVIDPDVSPAPTITCPLPDLPGTASGSNNNAIVTITPPTATGTGVSVSGIRSDSQIRNDDGTFVEDLNDPYPVGTTVITWTATDSFGRTASCTQRVIVSSADAPTISCTGLDKTFNAATGCGIALTSGQIGTPSATGLHVTVAGERSDHLDLYSDPYPVGQTIITWTATECADYPACTDPGARSVSCNQIITVTSSGNDSTPPILTIPDDVEVTIAACSSLLDDELGVATATDNCSSVSIARTGVPLVACPIPGNPTRTCESFVFPVGTTDVTYTATDAAGNQATGVQHVTVHGATPPTFTFVPADIGPISSDANSCGTMIGDATLGMATIFDNCDSTVIRTGVPAGNIFPVGETIITYTAKADLSVTRTQKVTVVDTTLPTVTPPGPVTLYTGTGATSCDVTVTDLDGTFGTGSATDNCPGVGAVTRSGVPAGGVFPVGETTLTYSATDAHNNTSTATQLVTVVDNTPPVFTFVPPTVVAYTGLGATTCDTIVSNATIGTAAATDNCGTVTVTRSPSGNTFPVGDTTITWTATDSANPANTTTATQVVTVVDNTAPVFTFVPPTVVAYTGAGATTCDTIVSNATIGTAAATDNCGTVTVTRSPSGNTFPVGDTTITWTATDSANPANTTTATQTITVIDNTVPVITVNGSMPSMWPPNHKYQTFQLTGFVTGASDNCGGIGVSNVVIEKVTSDETENGNGDGNTNNDIIIAANCKSVQLRSERDGGGNGRVYTITFKVTDTHGNVGRATSKVVVQHNPGQTAVDSGVHYTVNGTCP